MRRRRCARPPPRRGRRRGGRARRSPPPSSHRGCETAAWSSRPGPCRCSDRNERTAGAAAKRQTRAEDRAVRPIGIHLLRPATICRTWPRRGGLRSPAWPRTPTAGFRARPISRAAPPRSRPAAPAPRRASFPARRGVRGCRRRVVSLSFQSNEDCDRAVGFSALCEPRSPRRDGRLPQGRSWRLRIELANSKVLIPFEPSACECGHRANRTAVAGNGNRNGSRAHRAVEITRMDRKSRD